MTYASVRPNVIKLSLFLVIVLHESSITVVRADGRAIANTTGSHVTVRAEASSLSSIPVTHHASTDPSYANDNTSTMVSLVEAPVEVIGPRAVESEIRGKVDRKRESGIGMQGTSQRNSGYENENHACVLNDDGELRESGYKLYDDKTGSDVTRTVRTSAKRDARPGVRYEDVAYDEDQESGGSDMTDNEDDLYEDDEDDGHGDENGVVVDDDDDDEVRQNRRRKAGRRYRDGPKIWDRWGKWTSCSVSCGAGKLTRWRHCVAGGCSVGEKEAQLKTCTFSAC